MAITAWDLASEPDRPLRDISFHRGSNIISGLEHPQRRPWWRCQPPVRGRASSSKTGGERPFRCCPPRRMVSGSQVTLEIALSADLVCLLGYKLSVDSAIDPGLRIFLAAK